MRCSSSASRRLRARSWSASAFSASIPCWVSSRDAATLVRLHAAHSSLFIGGSLFCFSRSPALTTNARRHLMPGLYAGATAAQ
eukprot:4884675-Pyramimonas_sp.AAC.1